MEDNHFTTLWWPLTHIGTDQPQACMGSPILNTLSTALLPHSFWVACPRAPHLRALLHTLRVPCTARWSNLPVNPKGKQPWIFTGRNDSEVEAPIVWPPDVKSQIFGKDPDAGNDWGHEEKVVSENKMVEWYHQLNEHEFEQTPGDSEGQGRLACCNPWGLKESDMTWWLNKQTNKQTKKGKEMNK